MYAWLNKWYQLLLFSRHVWLPLLRLGTGRLHIWRDTPLWVVVWVAELDPERAPNPMACVAIQTARAELLLRRAQALKRAIKELKDAIEAEKRERGE